MGCTCAASSGRGQCEWASALKTVADPSCCSPTPPGRHPECPTQNCVPIHSQAGAAAHPAAHAAPHELRPPGPAAAGLRAPAAPAVRQAGHRLPCCLAIPAKTAVHVCCGAACEWWVWAPIPRPWPVPTPAIPPPLQMYGWSTPPATPCCMPPLFWVLPPSSSSCCCWRGRGQRRIQMKVGGPRPTGPLGAACLRPAI